MKTRYNPNALKNRLLFAVGCVILTSLPEDKFAVYTLAKTLFFLQLVLYFAQSFFYKAKRHIFAAVFAIFKAAERGVCALKSAGLGTGIRA